MTAQRNVSQMKEQNSRKKTKPTGDSQPIRCRVQNTGDKDAQRNHGVWQRHKWRNEGYVKWNKENSTGNQQWGEGRWGSNKLIGTQGRNKQSTSTEWRKKNLKKKQRIRTFWDISKGANICIIGISEVEEEEQEIENLFEKIMNESFPNLAKEIDIQVQEAQRVPNKLDPKRATPKHIIIKLPKIKDKES